MTTWMIAVILSGQLFVSNEKFRTLEDCEKAKPVGTIYTCMALTEYAEKKP